MKIKYAFTLIKNYRSFIFCNKVFGFKTALRLPVLIGKHVKCYGIKRGSIVLTERPYFGMVCLGISTGSSGIWKYDNCDGIIDLSGGTITFGQNINISKGFCLKAIEDSIVHIGSNFSANSYFTLLAKKEITIGKACLLGWNVLMNDGDGHSVVSSITGDTLNSKKAIIVHDHVWISANVSILKGTHIQSNSIVGYGSTIGRKFKQTNVCIAGSYPGTIVKDNINWK